MRRDTVSRVVDLYIAECRRGAQAELLVYRRMHSLKFAVTEAALCRLPNGKRHPHQRRIPGSSLDQARDRLIRTNLRGCASFEELHERVRRTIHDIRMIGPLAIYDIAHRIGAYLGMEPEHVYLHCGVVEGAKALGLPIKDGKLTTSQLPAAFKKLKPYEIEDCLCIYKRELANGASKNRNSCKPLWRSRVC
jgi:hypothetical protein